MEEGHSQESLIESRERSESSEGVNPTVRVDGPPGGAKCCRLSPQALVCISHAFSAWGDRMWHFAIGLYLVELTPGSLRLTAIYQLVSTLSIIIFGPLVGDWVDANPRLKVARVSLIIQNVAVIICGILLLIMLMVEPPCPQPHLPSYFRVLEALVIIIGSIADLSSAGTKIAVEKDWVVVLAGSDKKLLAHTNAILRRIDLCCKILAPILVGLIMTFISKITGVIFLAGWNVLSVFLEYYLLWKVFQSVKGLSQKVLSKRQDEDSENGSSADHNQDESQRSVGSEADPGDADLIVPAVDVRDHRPRKPGVFSRLWKRIRTFKSAWHIYFRQTVARPGLALASLYFTVISFGAITTGYAYTQCLSEAALSAIRGVGSLFGLLATFVFPRLRDSVGLVRSGLFSMSLQFTCLLFCAAAVFAPGSPFFLLPRNSKPIPSMQYCALSHTTVAASCSVSSLAFPSATPKLRNFHVSKTTINVVQAASTSSQVLKSSSTVAVNATARASQNTSLPSGNTIPSVISPTKATGGNFSIALQPQNYSSSTEAPSSKYAQTFSHISIGLLLAGIVTSRLGLWMSDLTISQLFQETVAEQERGIVAGMQNSFNSILGLIMYFLVIALPKPEQFGLLVLMSVTAVGSGGLLYSSFAYKVRGHLFHIDKFKNCLGASPPERMLVSDVDLEDEDEEEAMITGRLSTRNENFKF